MSFGSANGTLSIASMDIIRGDKLVGSLPGLRDGPLEGSTEFIVWDLEVHFLTFLNEPLHDRGVGSHTMSITPIFERGLENDIGVTIICDHNVILTDCHCAP